MSQRALIAALSALCALMFAASLLIGPAGLGLAESVAGLFAGRGEATVLVMREIRLPRALLGLLVGASLGLAGAALQGFLRNPLAEPGLIGVSPAAALGAVIAIYSGLSAAFPLALPILALIGAASAALLVTGLAAGRSSPITLILAGVAVSSLAGALTALALNLSPNPYAALEIVFWLMGSLTDRSMPQFQLAAPFVLIGLAILFSLGRALDAMSLGEDAARSLGVDPKRVERKIVAGAALSVGAATAVAGAIGFVGLIAPHLMRPLTGGRPSLLLPASALAGAILLLAADIAVRLLAPAGDLKLGVLTALIGAPFFLHLVLSQRREWL